MSEVNLFETAVMKKYRFNSPVGQLSVEDLYDLPLTTTGSKASLDNVAKEINRQIKNTEEESFVTVSTKASTELRNKLDILKHIISVRITERDAKKAAEQKKAQAQRIREILANKQDEALMSKGADELEQLLKDLEG